VDLGRERSLAEVLVAGSIEGILTAAHDVSDGGIAQVLVEMGLRSGVGARISIPAGIDPFVFLFSESTARAIVVIPAGSEQRLEDLCADRGVPLARVGTVDGSAAALQFAELFTVGLDELREAHEATIPGVFAPA
jgi:phosphoribosylformylglycinamidine synthase